MTELIYALTMRVAVSAAIGSVMAFALPEGTLKRDALRSAALALLAYVSEPVVGFFGGL